MAYVLLNMPCSELAVPVDLLLTQLQDLKSSEAEPKGEKAFGRYLRGCEELVGLCPAQLKWQMNDHSDTGICVRETEVENS
jgi:hypothetical protein